METTFNKMELDLAAEIINIGLAKAADSLSFFTRNKVLIRSQDLHINKFNDEELFSKDSEPLTLLATEIRGNMKGYCYLVFDHKEVDKMNAISLPKNVLEDPEQLKEMSKAVLMEMDNIVTAAVVTQFSNLFELDMHGYVPQHMNGSKADALAYIKQHAHEGDFFLHFNTPLYSESEEDISPEFVWCLDSSFVSAVKTFLKKDQYQVNNGVKALQR